MIESINSNIEFWKLCSTVVLALLAGLIAWRQSQTAQAKLDLDLFERREQIYLAAKKLIETVNQNTGDDPHFVSKFRDARQAARWLLDDECWEYLETLDNRATSLLTGRYFTTVKIVFDPTKPEQEDALMLKTIRESRSWFQFQILELPLVFAYQLTPKKAFFFPKLRAGLRVRRQRLHTQRSLRQIAVIYGDVHPETRFQQLVRWVRSLFSKVRP